MTGLPVVEVGGTHVAAARVDVATWRVTQGTTNRLRLRSDAMADEIIGRIAESAATLGPMGGSTLAVAMPGPFDYQAGIGRFRDVAKFDALDGVDVGSALRRALPDRPDRVAFVNDATAFGLGEWVSGKAKGRRRTVAITLGTGIGSVFLDGGSVVDSGPAVPPKGTVHLLSIDGRPLEDVVSRRAMLAAYRRNARLEPGAEDVDVRDIASRARDGETAALAAIQGPLRALGAALSPWLHRFDAEVLILGGAITASWALVAPALREGLDSVAEHQTHVELVRSCDPDESTAIGAAWHAFNGSGPR